VGVSGQRPAQDHRVLPSGPLARDSVAWPRHDDTARAALAEAVALLRHGEVVRDQLVTALARQPQFSERWLRALALELRR